MNQRGATCCAVLITLDTVSDHRVLLDLGNLRPPKNSRTETIFHAPNDARTKDYLTGRFG